MITEDNLQDYLDHFLTSAPKYLEDLERETYQKTVLPQMISGKYQGRVLSLLSRLKQPKNILEIGTFTGYATLCLAEGLPTDGQIVTIDKNDEFKALQDKYFDLSGYHSQIQQILGNARDVIPTLQKRFDLVFLDADKRYYPEYFELILPKMNQGGVILADNVLWYGKVLNDKAKDAETTAIKKYNEMLANDPRMDVVILPIRDGISMAIVK
jgi:caffeoyl-CoA O-methyltransferase